MYSLLYAKYVNGKESKWLKNLKSILNDSGYSNIWMNNQVVNHNWLIKSLKPKLTDQFQQNWESICNNFSKGVIYKLFTTLDFRCQPYVNCNLSYYMKQVLAKFRTSNNKLPTETGRLNDIERSNRLCNLCTRDIGDEFYYILCCTVLKNEREKYIPKFYLFRPNILNLTSFFLHTM